MNRTLILERLNATTFARGVIASTLTPFDEHGMVMMRAVTDQAKRLSQIDGILGIAVNTTIRERHSLSPWERLEILRNTRDALLPGQLVLACVGTLSAEVEDEVAACKEANTDAIITFPPRWRKGLSDAALTLRLDAFADLADSMPLPVIVALGDGAARRPAINDEIAALAQQSRKVIGFDMGADDNALNYDQHYFTMKAVDRPFACIPSPEGALSHHFNTGGCVLSCLAYLAPHEVTRLYQASRWKRFHDTQATHNRLSPMAALLSKHDGDTREMIYRAAAHHRGLLSSPHARGITEGLCPGLKRAVDDLRRFKKGGLGECLWIGVRERRSRKDDGCKCCVKQSLGNLGHGSSFDGCTAVRSGGCIGAGHVAATVCAGAGCGGFSRVPL